MGWRIGGGVKTEAATAISPVKCLVSARCNLFDRGGIARRPLPNCLLARQSLRAARTSQESRHQLFFSKRATPDWVSRTPRSHGKKVRGIRTRPAARTDSAIEARDLSGRSHVCAKTPSRPADGTNPDSPGGAQSKAGLLRSRWSSGPALSALWRSCVRLRSGYSRFS